MRNRNVLYCFKKLIFIFCFPRRGVVSHFIENNTNRPNIAFCCVRCPLKDLWSHVYWASNTRFEHLRPKVVNILCKSKITYFIHSIIYEYICRFKISMDYSFSDKLGKPVKYLSHNFESLIFLELLLL